jgi:hypothetical protein
MIKHKSRKQLRLEAAASTSALANLQTPEGLAGLVFEKSKDREFHVAFRDALETLYNQAEEEPASEENPEQPSQQQSA